MGSLWRYHQRSEGDLINVAVLSTAGTLQNGRADIVKLLHEFYRDLG